MSFTSRLGQPQSGLSNLQLGGAVTTIPTQYIVTVPSYTATPHWFTAWPSTNLFQPGNIVPGRPFMRILQSKSLSGILGLKGATISVIFGKLLYVSLASVITQLRNLTVKVVQRTTAQIDTQPFELDVSTRETAPINIDWTNYLSGNDSLTNAAPSAELKLTSTGASVSTFLAGTIGISGNVVQIPVDATVLNSGQSYYLLVTCTLSSGKRLTTRTQLNVVV